MNNNMLSGFMVYWVDITGEGFFPFHSHFTMDEMSEALSLMESLRQNPECAYVGMVSQNPNSVGRPGASSLLPADYAWSKQHRGDGIEMPRSLIAGRSNA